MTCSNCGAEIPIAGKVCPYCHHDKVADRERHLRNVEIIRQERDRTGRFALITVLLVLVVILALG